MAKKLSIDTLQVDTFEPAPGLAARPGTVYGHLTGQFGPACASDPPNCNDTGVYGPACASRPPNCNGTGTGGGQTSRCV